MAADVASESLQHSLSGAGSEVAVVDSIDSSPSVSSTQLQYTVPSPRAATQGQGRSSYTLSIIMAAYNEERTVARAVSEVLTAEYPCEVELIVVDDGSTDRTPQILAAITDPRVIAFRHDGNQGKGAALMSGVSRATGTHVLPFDADLEYTPDDIARLLDPVVRGRCNVVYGTRLFGYNTVYRSYWFAIGNKALTRLANLLYDAYLSDLHTCLKLVPRQLLQSLDLRETGFGLDTEVTALLLRSGIRPFEVPVNYFGRSRSEGKKINWRDAVACVWILLRVRFRRIPAASTASWLAMTEHDRRSEHNFIPDNNLAPFVPSGDESYAAMAD